MSDKIGDPCESCGATYQGCTDRILVLKRDACCSRCKYTGTHNERDAPMQRASEALGTATTGDQAELDARAALTAALDRDELAGLLERHTEVEYDESTPYCVSCDVDLPSEYGISTDGWPGQRHIALARHQADVLHAYLLGSES